MVYDHKGILHAECLFRRSLPLLFPLAECSDSSSASATCPPPSPVLAICSKRLKKERVSTGWEATHVRSMNHNLSLHPRRYQ